MNPQLITQEEFASVQEIQAGVTKLLKKAHQKGSFYRVMRNHKPLGYLFPNQVFEDLLEDLEAALSPKYQKRIAESRKSKDWIDGEDIEKELGI